MSDLRLDDVKAELAGGRAVIALVRGRREGGAGGEVHLFMLVPADQALEFAQASRMPGFRPENYGTLLIGGEGEPPQAVLDFLRDEQLFDADRGLVISADGA